MCPCACVCPVSPGVFLPVRASSTLRSLWDFSGVPLRSGLVCEAPRVVLRGYLSTYPSSSEGSSEDNTMPSILFLSTGEVGQFHLSRCPTSTQLNQHTRTNTYNAISNRGRRAGGAEPEAGAVETVDRGGEGGGGGGVFGHNLTRHYMRVSSKELSESLKAVR